MYNYSLLQWTPRQNSDLDCTNILPTMLFRSPNHCHIFCTDNATSQFPQFAFGRWVCFSWIVRKAWDKTDTITALQNKALCKTLWTCLFVNNLIASQDWFSTSSIVRTGSLNFFRHCMAKTCASSHCSVDLRGPELVCEPEVRQWHEHDLFPSGLHCCRCHCSTVDERARH